MFLKIHMVYLLKRINLIIGEVFVFFFYKMKGKFKNTRDRIILCVLPLPVIIKLVIWNKHLADEKLANFLNVKRH